MSFRPLPELFRRRFGTNDTAHVLCRLSYFDDADRERMPVLLRPADWETVKEDVRRWVREL